MKKEKVIKIALVMNIWSGFIYSEQLKHSNLDPIADLRAPRSLFELLHDGMNEVYVLLESVDVNDDLDDQLRRVESDLQQLSSDYDGMINRTRNNEVYQDDKEFLQKMIDRIDQLINELEGKKGQEDDSSEYFRSVRGLCHDLKNKIAA